MTNLNVSEALELTSYIDLKTSHGACDNTI